MANTSKSPNKRQEDAQIDEDVEDIPCNSLMSRLTKISEKVACTAIGQYGIKKLDNILRTVEQTAKWSLPQYTRVNNASPAKEKDSIEKIQGPPLTRPLPWIFFIPMLIALRVVRTGLSVGALLLRKDPVTPTAMVSYLLCLSLCHKIHR